MKIYQVLNKSGYPASFDENPQALLTTKKECKTYISELKEITGEDYTIEYLGEIPVKKK